MEPLRTKTETRPDGAVFDYYQAPTGSRIAGSRKMVASVATAASTNAVAMSWNDSSGVTYVVKRDGAREQRVNGNSFSEAGLRPDATYSYKVSPVGSVGEVADRTIVVTTRPDPRNTTATPRV